ncbi:fimbrial protein [Serratia fonticola]|uniref:fimbrial protein n=1 Tax=Serratia fonticola TaxID=47917 RepID=UPI001C448775|nr:fimbrial protein [Serratia fonticola]QXN65170.1 type 1 fimbrial protein [Serratia fonticola]QXN65201.1 type 1 fimbrial protein [Serratia fonticola]
MKSSTRITLFISVLVSLMLVKPVFAACSFAADSLVKNTVTTTAPLLGGNINVGPDNADGFTMFRQTYIPAFPNTKLQCDQAGLFYIDNFLKNMPLPLSSWNTGSYAGKVYETGVPGIGVVFWYSGQGFPLTRPASCAGANTTCTIPASNVTWDLSFIKIGPITPGVILGSKLPCVVSSVGQSGDAVDISQVCFSGALNVVSQTCVTPDVNVSMGSFDVNGNFNAVGATTPWKDASVVLTNCPRFYGTLNSQRDTFYSDDGNYGVAQAANNTIKLSLNPNTPIVSAANGIMNIKSTSNSASGVGIQMAYGNIGDASPELINFSKLKTYTMVNDTVTTLKLPLVARYIQTESLVSPGRADATVTFTITYF